MLSRSNSSCAPFWVCWQLLQQLEWCESQSFFLVETYRFGTLEVAVDLADQW